MQIPTLYVDKMGSICHFPFALPTSISGHGFQVLVLMAFGAHEKGNKLTFLVFCLLAFRKTREMFNMFEFFGPCSINKMLSTEEF